jgi:ATP-dependent RNA helicase RhlB
MDIEEYIGHKIPLAQINPELIVKPEPPARIESHRPGRPGDKRKPGGRDAGRKPAGRREDKGRQSREGKGDKRPQGDTGKRRRTDTVQVETPLSPSAEQNKAGPRGRGRKKDTPAIG